MKKSQLLTAMLLAVLMLLVISPSALASENTIQPMSAKSCTAIFTNSGASVSFGVDGYCSTLESSITVKANLQQYKSGTWTTIDTVSATEKNRASLSARKSRTVTKGYSYRVTVTCTAGGATKADTSSTKSI